MTETQPSTVRIEGWQQLAEALGILGGGLSMPSVTLTMDSRGNVKPEVKVYAPDPYKAKDDCLAIFEELRRIYGI